jgi:hypothetical protein
MRAAAKILHGASPASMIHADIAFTQLIAREFGGFTVPLGYIV